MQTQQTQDEALNALANYLKPLVGNSKLITKIGPSQEEIDFINSGWENWLRTIFPHYVSDSSGQLTDFADFHSEFWDYIWSIKKGVSPKPFVAIWSRSFAKSTSAELAIAMLAARGNRKYCIYLCESQDRSDDHVMNIASMLESSKYSYFYPDVSRRKLSKFGSAVGWRRNRLRTASGFTLDAVGLDKAIRGAKIEQERPDILIADDLDELTDTPKAIEEKVETLTKKILPAGSTDFAVVYIQNLIREDGIAAKLVYNQADFLTDKILSGPHKAIQNLEYKTDDITGKTIITKGNPTWSAVSIEQCQTYINLFGISAFEAEYQHNVNAGGKGMFKNIKFRHIEYSEIPDLVQVSVWLDPAVTDTAKSDSHGLSCGGIDADGNIYNLYAWEDRTNPREVILKAIAIAQLYKANHIGIETDQGGDLWEETYNNIWLELINQDIQNNNSEEVYSKFLENSNIIVKKTIKKIPFVFEKAGMHIGNKVHRATLLLADYETGRILHTYNSNDILEKALRRFPEKPLDLVDSWGWCWRDLRNNSPIFEIVNERKATINPISRNNIFGRERLRMLSNRTAIG